MYVIFSVLTFLVMFGALADIITIDGSKMKHLPKIVWIIVVILLPVIGSILWFLVGRVYPTVADRARPPAPRRANTMPSSPRDSGIVLRPRDTEAELAALEREIEADERAERIRELEATLEAKKRDKGTKD
jgi:hypothetical protein